MITMEPSANRVSILNMTQMEATNPTREMYHRERNEGRYDGADPKWCKNEIRQREP